MGVYCPKKDAEMTYHGKKNIYEAICQKLRNNFFYDTNMHKIYNLIVVQTNEQPQEKAESDTTLQAFNTVQYSISYLMILNNICFSKKYEQQPI